MHNSIVEIFACQGLVKSIQFIILLSYLEEVTGMGGFGGYNEKKNKKKKQGGQSGGQSFSSAPVFVAPQVIKKEKKEK